MNSYRMRATRASRFSFGAAAKSWSRWLMLLLSAPTSITQQSSVVLGRFNPFARANSLTARETPGQW